MAFAKMGSRAMICQICDIKTGVLPAGDIKKIAFLDRDGVINVDFGYVHKKEDFKLVPGIVDFLKALTAKKYKIVIVTNQSGIGRKYYTRDDFIELMNWVSLEMHNLGVEIFLTLYCPHVPHEDPQASCYCRKPKSGMIDRVVEHYSVAPANCILIGDQITDIQAANNAKLGRSYFINSSEKQLSSGTFGIVHTEVRDLRELNQMEL